MFLRTMLLAFSRRSFNTAFDRTCRFSRSVRSGIGRTTYPFMVVVDVEFVVARDEEVEEGNEMRGKPN